MSNNIARLNSIEIDDNFSAQLREVAAKLAQAEHDRVLYTDGLSVLEKKLMYKVDQEYYEKYQKRLPEYAQKRDAKRHPDYGQMVRMKAAAYRDCSLFRSEKEFLEMRFKEWQTRSVDRRGNT